MGEFTDAEREDLAERDRRYRESRAAASFVTSWAGQAKTAYERGDAVFQCSLEVMDQKASVALLSGAGTSRASVDATHTLNEISREGWEIVAANFVFVQTGQQSRDKLTRSGQDVAVSGGVIGYYVFRRSEK